MTMLSCIEQIMRILSYIGTPIIAVAAVRIAWQQAQINRQKLVLDRYDRRLRIYEEVRKILSLIMRDAGTTTEELLRYRTAVSEADFLFPQDIATYIDEIYKRGLKLWQWNQQYRDYTQEQPKGYDHKKVVEEMHKELNWLVAQFQPAKERFKKYLDVSA